MSLSCKAERSLVNHDEFEILRVTHHPAIEALDRDGLQVARARLKDLRDRERTLAFQTRRASRGKADARGSAFPGNAEKPLRRKQVFAGAVKRLNKQIARLDKLEARTSLMAAAQRALALRRGAERSHHPASPATATEGMRTVTNKKPRSTIPGSQKGSVSQATKSRQAKRDTRG